jgi:hypothetical protein
VCSNDYGKNYLVKSGFNKGTIENGGVNFEKVSTVLIFNVTFDQWL